jgi:hypothetical protein
MCLLLLNVSDHVYIMFGKIPDDMILSDGLKQAHVAWSAYMLNPRGEGTKHYTPDDYVNR